MSSYYGDRWMARFGIRYDTPTLEHLQESPRAKPVAFCASRSCMRKAKKTKAVKKANVKSTASLCPDCHHAPIWRSVSPGADE